MITARSLPHRKVTCAPIQKKSSPQLHQASFLPGPSATIWNAFSICFLEEQNWSFPYKIKISNDMFSLVICMSRMKLPASEAILKLSDRHYHFELGEQTQIFIKQPSTPLHTPKHDHVIKEDYLIQFCNSLSAWVSQHKFNIDYIGTRIRLK